MTATPTPLVAGDVRWDLEPRAPLTPPPADNSAEAMVVWLLRELRVWKGMTSVALDRIAVIEKELHTARRRNAALVDELRTMCAVARAA